MALSGKKGSVRERVTNNLFSAQSGSDFSGQKREKCQYLEYFRRSCVARAIVSGKPENRWVYLYELVLKITTQDKMQKIVSKRRTSNTV